VRAVTLSDHTQKEGLMKIATTVLAERGEQAG